MLLLLTKEKLPEYIVKCLQAAGYNELKTISNMDISENPGKIEDYIYIYIYIYIWIENLVVMLNTYLVLQYCPHHLNFH